MFVIDYKKKSSLKNMNMGKILDNNSIYYLVVFINHVK